MLCCPPSTPPPTLFHYRQRWQWRHAQRAVRASERSVRHTAALGCAAAVTTEAGWGSSSGLPDQRWRLRLAMALGPCIPEQSRRLSTGKGASGVLSLDVKVDAEAHGVVGNQVKLRCTFGSDFPVSEKVTVDWTYKPQHGGPLETIFHYQGEAYPTSGGIFKDRVLWSGDIGWKDASIIIKDLTLQDNGTFSCTVKNPPDVFSNIPHTVLTVTEESIFFRLSDASLLSILVFAPSTIVVILLLVRMGRRVGILRYQSKSAKKSSIEVSRETGIDRNPGCMMSLCLRCAHCIEDSDDEHFVPED